MDQEIRHRYCGRWKPHRNQSGEDNFISIPSSATLLPTVDSSSLRNTWSWPNSERKLDLRHFLSMVGRHWGRKWQCHQTAAPGKPSRTGSTPNSKYPTFHAAPRDWPLRKALVDGKAQWRAVQLVLEWQEPVRVLSVGQGKSHLLPWCHHHPCLTNTAKVHQHRLFALWYQNVGRLRCASVRHEAWERIKQGWNIGNTLEMLRRKWMRQSRGVP